MHKLNPNNPVVEQMDEQWYKLCALAVFKMGVSEVEFTEADIQAFQDSGRTNVVLDTRGGRFRVRLVDDVEAAKLAKQEEGLPV